MEYVLYTGVVIAVIGLLGLIYCMVSAYKARSSEMEGEALATHLRGLVAVNLGSFFVSVIGLLLVVLGIILQG